MSDLLDRRLGTQISMLCYTRATEIGQTEEGNTRRICKMQCLSVFSKVFGTVHQFPHRLKYSERASVDLGPGSGESMYRSSTKSRNDRR